MTAWRKGLRPLTPLYRMALEIRELRLRRGWEPVGRLVSPVISVGNLSTGGSGKTPLTIALARLLTHRGFRVDVLSRGYGRQNSLPARVDPNGSAAEFGDEPVLIARDTGVPVYVAARRQDAGRLAEEAAGAKALVDSGSFAARPERLRKNVPMKGEIEKEHPSAAKADTPSSCLSGTTEVVPFQDIDSLLVFPQPLKSGADTPCVPLAGDGDLVHLLDDGFQHRQLLRDVDILLLNRQDWHDGLLPAGNLREPLQAARRAGVIAIPADDAGLEMELRAWGWQGLVWRLRRTMEVPSVNGSIAAFCGIARPEQFFAGLESAGLRLGARTAFRDHHRYTSADLDRLLASARAAGAVALITTEKDQVRLGALACSLGKSMSLLTARLAVSIEHEDEAIDWLLGRLAAARTHSAL